METKIITKDLTDFIDALIKARHLEDVLDTVDRMLVDFMKVEVYQFILFNGTKPRIVKSKGTKEEDFNKEVIDTVIATGEPFITIDIDTLEITNQPHEKILICLPLEVQGSVIGLIEIRKLKENESINLDKYIILLHITHLLEINHVIRQVRHLCRTLPTLWQGRVKEYIRSLIFFI